MHRPGLPTLDTALAREVFDSAFSAFLDEEGDSVAGDVSEQNSCGRLAIYLTDAVRARGLAGYYADVEYNRKQFGQVKTIVNAQAQVIPIRCDLIVHSRGAAGLADNLIAVEMKKDRRPDTERVADRLRLEALTRPTNDLVVYRGGQVPVHVSGYRLGAFVLLVGRKRRCTVEYFVDGARVGSRACTFR